LFDLSCSSLRRASTVAEKIGCAISDDEQGCFDLESVQDIIFLLNDTTDVCLGFFEVSRETVRRQPTTSIGGEWKSWAISDPRLP
jgi:hypothetical protein